MSGIMGRIYLLLLKLAVLSQIIIWIITSGYLKILIQMR